MLFHALTDDAPIERVQRGKQGRYPIALAVVGHRLAAPPLQRQSGLCPAMQRNCSAQFSVRTW